MADADRLRMSYVVEVTPGTTPSSNLQDLRLTGESLSQVTATTSSAEIDSGRQTRDVVRTNVTASGALNFEFSYGTYDDFLKAALFSAGWSSAVALVAAASITITGATGNIGATGVGTNAVVGQWVRITGATNAENNTFAKVITITDVDNIIVDGGPGLVNETFTGSVSLGSQIVNGVAQNTFTIEKQSTDIASTYAAYPYALVEGMSLSVPPDGIITGSFNLVAQKEVSETSSRGTGYTAKTSTGVMNGIDNVLRILEATPAVSGDQSFISTSLSFDLNNNLRERSVIGTLGPISRGAGKCSVTGSLQAFFENKDIIEKYLNFVSSSLAWVMRDAAGNAYVFEFPRIKYTNGQRVAGGENTDILADMQFTAYAHETENVTVRVTRFPAS